MTIDNIIKLLTVVVILFMMFAAWQETKSVYPEKFLTRLANATFMFCFYMMIFLLVYISASVVIMLRVK